jgi:hypothetical protein
VSVDPPFAFRYMAICTDVGAEATSSHHIYRQPESHVACAHPSPEHRLTGDLREDQADPGRGELAPGGVTVDGVGLDLAGGVVPGSPEDVNRRLSSDRKRCGP